MQRSSDPGASGRRRRAALLGLVAVPLAILHGCSSRSSTDTPGAEAAGEAQQHLSTCITIQRGTFGTVEDATIAPNVASPDWNIGTLRVGAATEALLRFDVSAIPARSVINSAALQLTTTSAYSGEQIMARVAAAPWSEGTVTFTSFDQKLGKLAGIIIPSAPNTVQTMSVDVRRVQGWLDGTLPNHGLVLETMVDYPKQWKETAFVSSESPTAALRPALTVCYTTYDYCAAQPCQNGGACQGSLTGYTCACAPGFTGTNCETNIDDCAGNPCQNGAACVDGVNGYTCTCAPGYAGAHCETDVDDCAAAPCVNGGVCTDRVAGYVCSCPPGFAGASCETNIDDCAGAPCLNGATCVDGVNGYTCACAPGFSGQNCEINLDDCAGNACQNGATCVDGANGYTCACAPGFSGTHCEINVDECAGGPCQNGGLCADGVNGYTCTCPAGYAGDNCQIDVDDCASQPCADGSTCIDGVNSYTCTCPAACDVPANECQEALTCDPTTGQCVAPAPKPDGTPCADDGIACTADLCAAGQCAHVVGPEVCNGLDDDCDGDVDNGPLVCNAVTGDCAAGDCTVAQSTVPSAAREQVLALPGVAVRVPVGTLIDVGGAPVTDPVPVTVQQVTDPAAAPTAVPAGETVAMPLYRFGPSGATFSPPLDVLLDVPADVDQPSAWLCDDAGQSCEMRAGELVVDESVSPPRRQLRIAVDHFSTVAVASRSTQPLTYHGGPVLSGRVNLYVLFYGSTWSAPSQNLLTNLAANISSSPHFWLNLGYADAAGHTVTGPTTLAGVRNVGKPYGSAPTDAQIRQVIADAITAGFAKDPNGVYFVLGSYDVQGPNGMCTTTCGWHKAATISSANLKYAFVGDPRRCSAACLPLTPGPNGDQAADAMALHFANALAGAVTNPEGTGWFSSDGKETYERCTGSYGTTFAAGGGRANVHIGARDYLLQQNWSAATGACTLLSPPPAGACSGRPNGTPCNDGNLCTAVDTCQGGVCVGASPTQCPASANPCVPNVCHPASGQCQATPKADGSACSDGNACTSNDTCHNGLCSGTTVVCPSSGCLTGACSPATGTCVYSPRPNGTACNDQNACTQTDVCTNGVCKGAPVANGTACNDGDGCTLGDTCQSGACRGSSRLACPGASDPCMTGVCLSPSGTCTTVQRVGNACDDGNACTAYDACQATGACVGSAWYMNGRACTDGDACTVGDTCKSGVCLSGAPKTCTASDACHVAGTCNPATGTCSNPAAPNGTTCSDGSACTQTDTCQNGACTGSNPVSCPAPDQCHAGLCNAATGGCGSVALANGTPCNDGNPCTLNDTCQSGVCTGGAAVVCAASDACHLAGVCNPATGACSNPAAPNGTACNDGNACTQTDTCQSGVCTGQNPKTCAASDACHVAGTCNPTTGACSNPAAPNGTSCNDGNACTTGDSCQSGVCTSTPVVCAPSDQCHGAGTCNGTTGACSNPVLANGTACDDGNPCTTGDSCQSGACSSGTKVWTGIQIETRPYTGGVPGSTPAAISAWNGLPIGAAGYGAVRQLATVAGFSNQATFGGTASNIAYHVKVGLGVTAAQAGVWGFRFAGDFGKGGTMLVDGVELQARWTDMYWGGSFTNAAQYLAGTINLSKGFHTIDVYGFEDGLDGPGTMEWAPPGGAYVTVTTGTANTCQPPDGSSSASAPPSCWVLRGAYPALPSGTYWIDPDGTGPNAPFQTYCDMSTSGGGWTLVTSRWIPGYTPPQGASLGQNQQSGAIGLTYTQAWLQCQSNTTTVNRIRTFGSLLNHLDSMNVSATETYLTGDNVARPSNASIYFGYPEWHSFAGTAQRYILRSGEVHCALDYLSVGGQTNNPALGRWGQIWVR